MRKVFILGSGHYIQDDDVKVLRRIFELMYHLFTFYRLREKSLNQWTESNKYITFAMKSSELLRILLEDGWYIKRQSGSHLIMKHPQKASNLVVPFHGSKELGKGLVAKMLKDAGIQ